MSPTTTGGRILAVIIMFFGISLIAMLLVRFHQYLQQEKYSKGLGKEIIKITL